MNELLTKINEGKYVVQTLDPLSIQCALFLTQCLQANEADRINMAELQNHPFLASENDDDYAEAKLTVLKPDDFLRDQQTVGQSNGNLKLKPSTSGGTQAITSQPFEFTTQELAQSAILKHYLSEKQYNEEVPRMGLEESKANFDDDIEVEKPHTDGMTEEQKEQLLIVQR